MSQLIWGTLAEADCIFHNISSYKNILPSKCSPSNMSPLHQKKAMSQTFLHRGKYLRMVLLHMVLLSSIWHLLPPRAYGEKDAMWFWRWNDQNVTQFLLVLLKWSFLVMVCMVWGNPSSRYRGPREELEPQVHSPAFIVSSTSSLVI